MRRVLLMSVVLVAGLAGLTACGGGDAKGPGGPGGGPGGPGGPPGGMQLPVETYVVKPQSFAAGVSGVGSLRADEQVVVRPEVGGRIAQIHFTEGTSVRAGQPLFSLDASLARASLNEAAANLENSRRAAARTGQLIGQQMISRADHDRARAALGVDQARVASARAALSKMTLTAPFSGQVGLREVSVGEVVNAGQALVTLVRLDPIEVDFSVPESQIPNLRRGQKVRIEVDAYPGDSFGGEVVAIDPVIDPVSRSSRLRARIGNPDGRLRPGQFARLQLDTGAGQTTALLVPEQALMQDGATRFVYTVVAGKAKRTEIRTGARTPGFVQVTDGLAAGDVVITAGQAKPMMRDGVPVASVNAPAAPANAATPAKPSSTTTAPAK
ncbi:efflux RND transporter periplasmic adaptor subunit [Lysobacter humi (ex Lee et al. 2017)]